MGDMAAPDVHFYQEQRRHGECPAVEDSRYHLAAAPFYLLFVVGYALPGREYIVYDDNLFPFDIPGNEVIPFEDTVLAAFGFMQALARLEHIDIVQPRSQLRPVLADVPVEPFEALAVFYPVAARHEHDMIGFAVRLQGGHTCLEELDAMYLPALELVDRTAERPLLVVEQRVVPGRIVMPVESHSDAV